MGLYGKGADDGRAPRYERSDFSLVPLVGETYVRFMSPAYLNDRIEVRVTVGDHHVEKGYAKLDFRFSNKTTGQLIAQGYHIIFFYDSKTGKRVPISGEFRKLL